MKYQDIKDFVLQLPKDKKTNYCCVNCGEVWNYFKEKYDDEIANMFLFVTFSCIVANKGKCSNEDIELANALFRDDEDKFEVDEFNDFVFENQKQEYRNAIQKFIDSIDNHNIIGALTLFMLPIATINGDIHQINDEFISNVYKIVNTKF